MLTYWIHPSCNSSLLKRLKIYKTLMGYGFNASSHYPSFAFQSRSQWSFLLPCNHLPAQLIFCECSPESLSGTWPASPGCGGPPVSSTAATPSVPFSAAGRAKGKREGEKAPVRAGEEINGSVQEEWWREIQKAVNSPFRTARTWQEFHSLLIFQSTHVHSSETSHIWPPGWGVNFL